MLFIIIFFIRNYIMTGLCSVASLGQLFFVLHVELNYI